MTTLSLLIITAYLLFIVWKYGILPSYSDSYYHLKNKKLFIFVMMLFPIPLLVVYPSIFLFLATGSLWFVGAAANFKKKITDKVHYGGAIAAILFSLLEVVFVQNMLYLAVLFVIALIVIYKYGKNPLWWIETAALITLYISLYF